MAKSEWMYGIHTVSAILSRYPERVLEVRFQEGRTDKRLSALVDQVTELGLGCSWLPRHKLDQQLGGNHQGVLARCRLAQPLLESDLFELLSRKDGNILLLVLDEVTDPHNLGACLRSADAAGVDAVVTTRDKAVGLTPVVRRVAVGAAETVPFVQVTNLARTLKKLVEAGVWIVGAAVDDQAKSIYDVDLKGNIALVMGAEGKGLRRLTQSHCDHLTYIPMSGAVESLNVSVATGICLFEAVRQRALKYLS